MGRPPASTPRSISREIKNWINRFSAVQAIAICPKCTGIHDPPATPERGTLALDPSDSHPLRLKRSKCKTHLAAQSHLKTAVVIAEVPFLPEQTECPCYPDEVLALSNTTANIKDNLNETRQIFQTTCDERDELQLEVEKLRRIPDPETATGTADLPCISCKRLSSCKTRRVCRNLSRHQMYAFSGQSCRGNLVGKTDFGRLAQPLGHSL